MRTTQLVSSSAEREKRQTPKSTERASKLPLYLELVGAPLEAETTFLSPDFVPSYDFPYNPDPLVPSNNYDVYDEMRDDDQIKAAISIKKDMVVNTGWKISCDEEEVSEFVTRALNAINSYSGTDGTFDDVLRDMLSAYEYGFSISEPVYEFKNGLWYYKTIKTRPPHSFKFHLNPQGDVEKITQTTDKTEITIDPKRVLHYAYQMEFGNPYGKSDLKAAHDPWKAKKFVTKFFNIYLERFASPTVVGKYPRGYSTQEITKFFDSLKSLQNNTTAAIPEDAKVDFVLAARDSTDSYCMAIDKYNMQIARAILVPDLLGLSGGATGGGAYALGKEHFKVFMGAIKKDRESLARKITQKLVAPLVAVNFGEEYAANVKFEFIPFSDDNIAEFANTWISAVKSGVFDPSDDEINHLRALTGFPQGPVNRPQKMEPPLLPDGTPNPKAGQPLPGQPNARPGEEPKDGAEIEGKPDAGVPKTDAAAGKQFSDQARVPAGSPDGGQFAPGTGGDIGYADGVSSATGISAGRSAEMRSDIERWKNPLSQEMAEAALDAAESSGAMPGSTVYADIKDEWTNAVAFTSLSDSGDMVTVQALGSDGHGGGTRIMGAIFKDAAAQGRGVVLSALPGSKRFYRSIGGETIDGDTFAWAPAVVKGLVSQPGAR